MLVRGSLMVDGWVTAQRAVLACTFAERARGLLGRETFAEFDALCLRPCGAVHSLAMRTTIDVAFCDREGRILQCHCGLPAWRFAACAGAVAAWEWRAGVIATLGFGPGTRLAFQPDATGCRSMRSAR